MSNPPDFTTAFEGLRTAVTRANELQEGFYQSLPGTLGEINRDLQGITEQIEGIISHEFNFEDIQKAFDTVADYKDQVLKCIIKMPI